MRPDQRGFALLIVLWTVGLLALIGTRIVADGQTETRLTDNLKQEAVLQAAADGAVAEAVFLIRGIDAADMKADGQERTLRVGRTPVLVRVENEGDRINLNRASYGLLQALLTGVGNSPVIANQLAAAILTWRSSGKIAEQQGATAADYQAAGKVYGPPEAPFQSVDELARVLGIGPELVARLAPHLTVLTEDDADGSTRDPVVAQALADAGENLATRQVPIRTLRIEVLAMGERGARYDLVVVARAEFQGGSPSINILSRERPPPDRAITLARSSPGDTP